MSSPSEGELAVAHRDVLLETARAAIAYGVEHGNPMTVRAEDYAEDLRLLRATFVTLRVEANRLRGCIGTSEPIRPLVEDVCRNAFSAAFLDPRFTPVERGELGDLHIQISVLSPLEEMKVASAADLVSQMRPGIDGLLIEDSAHRGTLLPSVWEALPDADVFLRELMLKAGLAADYWSPDIRVYRYTAECFP